MKKFQSLFWWITSWVYQDGNGQPALVLFQSLFWWITSWVRSSSSFHARAYSCFNPCSGGSHPGSAFSR